MKLAFEKGWRRYRKFRMGIPGFDQALSSPRRCRSRRYKTILRKLVRSWKTSMDSGD